MSRVFKKEDWLRFAENAFISVGVAQADAEIAAGVLVQTEMRGVKSHGLYSLPRYVRCIKNGDILVNVRPRELAGGPAWTLLDGGRGLGFLTAHTAMSIAMEKAKKCGVAVSSVRGGKHFGAAGYYSLMCAKAGMFGMAAANTDTNVAATGSAGRSIGTNPLSMGTPLNGDETMVLDIAMSKVAAGKVDLAKLKGEMLPPGLLIDKNGNPTTDPAQYGQGGALTPFGEHKGYGIAVMVEYLAAVLSGAHLLSEASPWAAPTPGAVNDVGYFMLAIDIRQMVPVEEYNKRVRTLAEGLHGCPTIAGVNRVYLPGEPENEMHRKAEHEGFAVSEETWNALTAMAEELSVPLPS